ncbi:hypothetical protein [Sulfitobacter sp. PM12]|uniref:hypothetical protein n=1 Tax=Sulfitobacter sp. PM12 TaxID=3138497 RepID=UPI00388F9861
MTPDEQTVERYSVEPWDIRRADMKPDPEGQYVRYDDHCAAIAAMKEAGMDRLVAEGQRCDAIASARNDALREAAGVCQEYSKDHGAGMFDVHSAECERRILALIKEPVT